jgi:hypothetical protein
MDGDDVVKDLREAALKAIDEAGSLIIALVVEAMLQRAEERMATVVVEEGAENLVDQFSRASFPASAPLL